MAGELVLVAGATGAVGSLLVGALERHGYRVRALGRNATKLERVEGADESVVADAMRDDLGPACQGVDAVFSCIGAPLTMSPGERAGYLAVDLPANLRLLDTAKTAGARRFAYLSLLYGERLRQTRYADAHERVVEAVRASGMDSLIVRPNGIFWIFAELLASTKSGKGMVIGDGSAKTNPVHEIDVAELAAAAFSDGVDEVEIGGPETFTRREVTELAIEAFSGRPGKVISVPAWSMKGMALAMRPLHPRLSDFLVFGVAAATGDLVGPPVGTRKLGDYLRAAAG